MTVLARIVYPCRQAFKLAKSILYQFVSCPCGFSYISSVLTPLLIFLSLRETSLHLALYICVFETNDVSVATPRTSAFILVLKLSPCVVCCYAAYDAHLANYSLYNRFLHNMICCHNTSPSLRSIRRTPSQLYSLKQILTQHDMLPQHQSLTTQHTTHT